MPRVSQSAMAGSPPDLDVFAHGHLGELTQILPVELIDAVLAETRSLQRRLRSLPSRVGVYFLLALGLFEHLGARLVWATLTGGLAGRVPALSEKALRDLCRRIGAAPLRRLFEVIAVPLGQPATPGVYYRYERLYADGAYAPKWYQRRITRPGARTHPAHPSVRRRPINTFAGGFRFLSLFGRATSTGTSDGTIPCGCRRASKRTALKPIGRVRSRQPSGEGPGRCGDERSDHDSDGS